MYEARRQAIGRMTEECQALGGHGVVGVRLTIGGFPAGGLEFKAIGTAIRAPGAAKLRTPFTSDLSGQDFAKLIMAGWVPAGLVLGIAIGARHDDWITVNQTRWGAGNTEVAGYTDLVNAARHDARHQLERDVARHGADGVVLQEMDYQGRRARVPRPGRAPRPRARGDDHRHSDRPLRPPSRQCAPAASDHVAGPAASPGGARPARPVRCARLDTREHDE